MTNSIIKSVTLVFLFSTLSTIAFGQSIDMSNAPTTLAPGSTTQVPVGFNSSAKGIIQLQLFDSNWNLIDNGWKSIPAGSGTKTIRIVVPTNASTGDGYFWQGLVYDAQWNKLHESIEGGVSIAATNTINLANVPMVLQSGQSYDVDVGFSTENAGVIQLQLFDSNWNLINQDWSNFNANQTSRTLTIDFPASATSGTYLWQGLLYDESWGFLKEEVVQGVGIGEPESDDEFLPNLQSGEWVLDWSDEFSGEGMPDKWFPFLGTNQEEFGTTTEKGIRWLDGNDPNTAAMYSTKEGNHWLDGNGNLVMQAVTDKRETNALGRKVKTAYLMSGYPGEWDQNAPENQPRAIWEGKFVSPKAAPLYISARIRTNEVVGHSTWFAFWLFSKTRAYNSNPVDGTEVDIMEIAKGAPDYMDTAFNVANHWNLSGGSESLQINTATDPPASSFVDVTDDQYHVYGIEWTTTYMKCYVDGKLYYTFTDNIPSDPVDMMMLLTFEYQKNLWDPNAGDGRFTGPFVDNSSPDVKVMSRAYVDYVHVWKKQ